MKQNKKTTKQKWWKQVFVNPFLRIESRIAGLLARRPHRSFRYTRRRDYVRSLKLPGYWSFTAYVAKTIWRGRKTLLLAVLVYAVVAAVVIGWASQEVYADLGESLREAGHSISEDGLGVVAEAGLLLGVTVLGNLSGATTPEAQVFASILSVLFWLLIVWLLRSFLAGNKVKLRDGLYRSGAPFVPTVLVFLALFLQLIPIAIAIIAFGAGSSTGLLAGGVEAMLVWIAIILLGVISLYWIISTMLALVVVTLPGMYPMQAIRTAGDLVIGRRIRIFLRFIWMFLVVAAAWAVIMIPIIIVDSMIKDTWPALNSIPIVPIVLLIMTSLTLLFVSSYIYLIYRKIVDDDAKPA